MRAIERSGMWVSVPVILLAILGLAFLPGCPSNPPDDDSTDGDDDDGEDCDGGDCICAGQSCVCVSDTECDIVCETDGGNCAVECNSDSLCTVDCDGSDSCAVECQTASECEVDCSDSASCAVTCPSSNCIVHNCEFGLGCAVTCGTGGIPTQQGDDWVCM